MNWVIVNTVGGTAEFASGATSIANSSGISSIDVVFTPNAGFSGTGSISFNVNDGANTSNTASVDIVVGGTGGTTTSSVTSAPALSLPGVAALFLGMLVIVLLFLMKNRSRSQS